LSKPRWHPPAGPPFGSLGGAALYEGFATNGLFTESPFMEFKTGAGTKPIQETVVAFSNAEGGTLLIGVTDEGSIVGASGGKGQATSDAAHDSVRAVRDPGRYQIHQLDVDGREVVAVSVCRRVEGFAQMADGRVLQRRGARNAALMGAELADFVSQRLRRRYEQTDTAVPVPPGDGTLPLRALDGSDWLTQAPAERLVELGLATPQGTLTVAGALLLLRAPQEHLGKAYVEVFRYPGDSAEYDRRMEIVGPLHHQIESAARFVGEELGVELVVVGMQRHELPKLPTVVLREAIANALAHRDYQAAGTATRIDLYPDRVVVRSPGGLLEPVTVENIRDQQAARNTDLIRVLRRLGLAEDAGRGVDVMQDVMQSEMLDPPRFADHGTAVEVILPIRSAVSPLERTWIRELQQRGHLEPADRLVLVAAARGQALSNRSVRDLLHVDSVAARRTLRRLRDGGYLDQVGSRGGALYRLGSGLSPPLGVTLAPTQLLDEVADLAVRRPITNADVRRHTGLDRQQALHVLQVLVRQERLRQVGERRTSHYLSTGMLGESS